MKLRALIILSLFIFLITTISYVSAGFLGVEGYKIQVSIPGTGIQAGTEAKEIGIGYYVGQIFKFGLIAIGLVAFGAIVFGAIQYTISAGNDSQIKDAKDRILHGIYGLVLLLLSVLILQTINPNITSLKEPSAPNVSSTQIGTMTEVTFPSGQTISIETSGDQQGHEKEMASCVEPQPGETDPCVIFYSPTSPNDARKCGPGAADFIKLSNNLYCIHSTFTYKVSSTEQNGTYTYKNSCQVRVSLKDKLCQLVSNSKDWLITEAWPPDPKVGHQDTGHYDGCAVDISVVGITDSKNPTTDECQKIKEVLDKAKNNPSPFGYIRNEYKCPDLYNTYGSPSANSTGGHIHLSGC